jgi:rubrerythrin
MAIENRNLPVGTRLVASYKKQAYVCTVDAGEEEGALAFVLEDGSRHKSPSAAGSKVMGGKAVNGWRFWTVEGDELAPAQEAKAPEKKARGSRKKSTKVIFRTPRQDVAKGKSSWFCSGCMKSFVVDGEEEPQQCPEGHRIDDPELNAPAGLPTEAEVSA